VGAFVSLGSCLVDMLTSTACLRGPSFPYKEGLKSVFLGLEGEALFEGIVRKEKE